MRAWHTVAANGRKNADGALMLALARGDTVQAAAAAAGVSERTAYRRAADVAFRRRLVELRAQMVSRALGKLADTAAAAVETLHGLLHGESGTVQLGAARAILELGNQLRKSVDLEARISVLEQQIPGEGHL
jgi:hypothetical protein